MFISVIGLLLPLGGGVEGRRSRSYELAQLENFRAYGSSACASSFRVRTSVAAHRRYPKTSCNISKPVLSILFSIPQPAWRVDVAGVGRVGRGHVVGLFQTSLLRTCGACSEQGASFSRCYCLSGLKIREGTGKRKDTASGAEHALLWSNSRGAESFLAQNATTALGCEIHCQ